VESGTRAPTATVKLAHLETWIKTASAEQLENNCLVIRTPTPLLEIGYRSTHKTISDVVQDIVGHAVEIHITVARDGVSQL